MTAEMEWTRDVYWRLEIPIEENSMLGPRRDMLLAAGGIAELIPDGRCIATLKRQQFAPVILVETALPPTV